MHKTFGSFFSQKNKLYFLKHGYTIFFIEKSVIVSEQWSLLINYICRGSPEKAHRHKDKFTDDITKPSTFNSLQKKKNVKI